MKRGEIQLREHEEEATLRALQLNDFHHQIDLMKRKVQQIRLMMPNLRILNNNCSRAT
jgi:hypothetical protein